MYDKTLMYSVSYSVYLSIFSFRIRVFVQKVLMFLEVSNFAKKCLSDVKLYVTESQYSDWMPFSYKSVMVLILHVFMIILDTKCPYVLFAIVYKNYNGYLLVWAVFLELSEDSIPFFWLLFDNLFLSVFIFCFLTSGGLTFFGGPSSVSSLVVCFQILHLLDSLKLHRLPK